MMSSAFSDFEQVLATGGLRQGLSFLNLRVPHRFTAVYRLDAGMLRVVEMVDKEGGLEASALEAVPLGDSFCQFTMRDGSFVTPPATGPEERLNGHPYHGIVQSYVGLPLTRSAGELFGTFCHYDFARHPVSEEEYQFLVKAARLLPRFV